MQRARDSEVDYGTSDRMKAEDGKRGILRSLEKDPYADIARKEYLADC